MCKIITIAILNVLIMIGNACAQSMPDSKALEAHGTWSITTRRHPMMYFDYTATRLADGRVLVTYSDYSTGHLFTGARVYDPETKNWSINGRLNTARGYHHTATLLSDDRVLVVGGCIGYRSPSYSDCSSSLSAAEVYDPQTETWTVTGNLSTGRMYHTTTLLADGRVLVVGGWNGNSLSSAEVYDPKTGIWNLTGSMSTAREYHTATLLSDGRVLVVGGTKRDACLSAEVYNPQTGTWKTTGHMGSARVFHQAVRLVDGRVLIMGGGNGGISLSSAEIYDPKTGTWSATGSMSTGRGGHRATLLNDGRVLVAGGSTSIHGSVAAPVSSAEIYDPQTETWQATGSMKRSRSGGFTATLLIDGRVLVVDGGGAELYQP